MEAPGALRSSADLAFLGVGAQPGESSERSLGAQPAAASAPDARCPAPLAELIGRRDGAQTPSPEALSPKQALEGDSAADAATESLRLERRGAGAVEGGTPQQSNYGFTELG